MNKCNIFDRIINKIHVRPSIRLDTLVSVYTNCLCGINNKTIFLLTSLYT